MKQINQLTPRLGQANQQVKRLMRHLRGEICLAPRSFSEMGKHLGGEGSQRVNRQSNVGAALVITLIVVTVISAIVFSVSRMLVSEVKQITRLEDSEMAYQAAESGIEAGLLLYRYNKNIEVPADVTGGMDEKVTKAMRVNVTDGKLESNNLDINANLADIIKSKSYYDLRIWHKNYNKDGVSVEEVNSDPCAQVTDVNGVKSYPVYCVPDYPGEASSTQSIPALAKDGSVEYNINKLDGKIYLKWGYTNVSPSRSEKDQMRLEYTAYDADGQIVENGNGKKLFTYFEATLSQGSNGIPLTTTNAQDLRIKSWGGDLDNYKMTLTSPNEKLDSRYTYIESTGYYASSKRKLKVKIDRQTGSIVSTYDFVLLSPGNITGQ
ncbi:MAG: hypothetical protein ACD_58C00151G0001 [uncultured bacterium]|nr:MAG: hypothetical protein ACD_58C00151G0001 [uncultured bacterium]